MKKSQTNMQQHLRNCPVSSEDLLSDLMDNVQKLKFKRQQILNNHSKNIPTFQSHDNINTEIKEYTDKENQQSHLTYQKNNNYPQTSHKTQISELTSIKILHASNTNCPHKDNLTSSNRPLQQTLQPYLMNIQQEYVYPSSIQIRRAQKEENPSRNSENNLSISLSDSRQESEEMLLQNSMSSKFLESPTLSLGLIESKITHKSTKTQNAYKKQTHNHQSKHNEKVKLKQLTEDLLYFADSHVRQTTKSKQIFKQSLKNKIMNQPQVQLITQNTNSVPLDPQLQSSLITSYQMEVEYLQKINFIQSLEIQKLRSLVRLNQTQATQSKNTHQSNKKAIDILCQRQKRQLTKLGSTLQQKTSNTCNNSIQGKDYQLICSDENLFRKSIALTTNTKINTAHTLNTQSVTDKKDILHKSINKKKTTYCSSSVKNQRSDLKNHHLSLIDMDINQSLSLNNIKAGFRSDFMKRKEQKVKKENKFENSLTRNLSLIVKSDKQNLEPRILSVSKQNTSRRKNEKKQKSILNSSQIKDIKKVKGKVIK